MTLTILIVAVVHREGSVELTFPIVPEITEPQPQQSLLAELVLTRKPNLPASDTGTISRVTFALTAAGTNGQCFHSTQLRTRRRTVGNKAYDVYDVTNAFSVWRMASHMHGLRQIVSKVQRAPAFDHLYVAPVARGDQVLLVIQKVDLSASAPPASVNTQRVAPQRRRRRRRQVGIQLAGIDSEILGVPTTASVAVQPGSCQVVPWEVNFSVLGWHPWIIYPQTYNAGRCAGTCVTPIGSNYSREVPQTHHADLKMLYRHHQPATSADLSVCCSPAQFGTLQVIFRYQNDTIVVKVFEQMKVTSCMCV